MAEMEQEPLGVSREGSQLSRDSDEEERAAQQQRLEVVQQQTGDIGGTGGEKAIDTVMLSGGSEDEEERAAQDQRLEVPQRQQGDNIGGAGGEQAVDTVLLPEGSEEEGAAHQQRLEVVQLQKGDNIDGADEEQSFDTILPGGPEEEEGAAHQQRLEVVQLQKGDNMDGADEEQSFDTILPGGPEEEEGAAHQQRLEVAQRQMGDNICDADGITKPLPMRPYPVAGDDTSASDPVTPESDDSGKNERNAHQAAIASAPSPQVTDDSVGTSVGGSGGDHSPKLPLEHARSGMELLGNEVRTELDGGSTSHGSSTGDVPAASPALLSTSPPPLGHCAGIAAASSPQATHNSVGTSVGGSGRVPTPKLPSQSGMKLLGNDVSTEIGGDSTSRDSSAGGVPTTSPAPLSTSPAPLGHRAAIASASSPRAADDPVGTSVGGSGGGHIPKLPSQKSGMKLLRNEVPTELDGDSTSRDSSTGGVPTTSPAPLSVSSPPLFTERDSASSSGSQMGTGRSFGDGGDGSSDDASSPFEQEHVRKEVGEHTSEGAPTIKEIDATREQEEEGALTGGVQATSPALLSTSPAPFSTEHGISASSNGRRTGAGGGLGGDGDRADDGASRPFEQEHSRDEQTTPVTKETNETQEQEEEEALTEGVPATSPALLSTPPAPLSTEHGTSASSNGRQTGAGGCGCDGGDRANDGPSRPFEQERARDEQTTPVTKETNETQEWEEEEEALRGLLRPFEQERARKESHEQPGQGTPVSKETNDTQEKEETLLLRARIKELETSAQTQASKHGEAERRAESLGGELRGLADRCRLETAARKAAERDAQRCMDLFAEARVAWKDARVVAEGKDRELASEIAAREAAERNAKRYTDLFAEARAAWSNTQTIVENKERELAAAEARVMKTEAGGGFGSLQRRLEDAKRGRELDRQQSLELKLALEEQLAAGGGTSEDEGRGSSVDDDGRLAATGEVPREGRVAKVGARLEAAVAAEAALAAERVPALVASVEAKAATGQAAGGGDNSGGRIATPRQGVESRGAGKAESLSPTRRVILERERVAAAEARLAEVIAAAAATETSKKITADSLQQQKTRLKNAQLQQQLQQRQQQQQQQQQQRQHEQQHRQHAQQQEQQLNRASLSSLRPGTASPTRKTQLSPSAPSYFPPSMTAAALLQQAQKHQVKQQQLIQQQQQQQQQEKITIGYGNRGAETEDGGAGSALPPSSLYPSTSPPTLTSGLSAADLQQNTVRGDGGRVSDQLSASAGGSDAGVGSGFARLDIGSPPTAAKRLSVPPLVFAGLAGEEKGAEEWIGQPHEQHALTLLHAPEEDDVSDAGSGSFEGLHPSPTTPNIYTGSERAAGSGIDGRFSDGTRHDHDGHVAGTAANSGMRSPLASAETARNLIAASGAAAETPGGAEKLFRDYSSTYGSSACGNAGRGAKEVILRAGTFLERLEKAESGEEGLITLEVDGGSVVKVVMEERKFIELHETKEEVGELLTTLGATCFAL